MPVFLVYSYTQTITIAAREGFRDLCLFAGLEHHTGFRAQEDVVMSRLWVEWIEPRELVEPLLDILLVHSHRHRESVAAAGKQGNQLSLTLSLPRLGGFFLFL